MYSGKREIGITRVTAVISLLLTEKVTFEKRMKGGEGVEHPDNGNSQGRAPRQDHTRQFLQE